MIPYIDLPLLYTINNFAGQIPALDIVGVFAAVFLLPLMAFLLLPAAFTIKRLREEHWYEMPVKALLAALIALGIRTLLGVFASRARPFVSLTDVKALIPMDHLYDSFPSGHAAIAFALALVVFKHDRDWGVAFLILAALVALSRVFVGVHYPSDILGGAILGWGAAAAVHWFEKRQWSKLERALRVR